MPILREDFNWKRFFQVADFLGIRTTMAKKKFNDDSNFYKDWTVKKLKSEAKSYHELIHGEMSCYGKSDLMTLDGIMNELSKRGIEPRTELVF